MREAEIATRQCVVGDPADLSRLPANVSLAGAVLEPSLAGDFRLAIAC